MTTYINIRDILIIEEEEREYIDRDTKIKGVVRVFNIKTKDGETIINMFKDEVKQND